MRVAKATVAARPTRLPPQMKAADHHLRRLDQAVMQTGKIARPESTRPMRVFQLTSQPHLAVRDSGQGEEAILEVTRQERTVFQVFDRLPLGVQHALYALDDWRATGEKELEKVDMRWKRYLARTRSAWPLVGRTERMKGHRSRQSARRRGERAFFRSARALVDLSDRAEMVRKVRYASGHSGEFHGGDLAWRLQDLQPALRFIAKSPADLAPRGVVHHGRLPRLVPLRVGEGITAGRRPLVHQ